MCDEGSRLRVAREIEARIADEGISLRELCRRLGQPESMSALLSKLLRGESITDASARKLGRALGVVAPPRRLIRRVMTEEQAAAWDACPPHERAGRLR